MTSFINSAILKSVGPGIPTHTMGSGAFSTLCHDWDRYRLGYQLQYYSCRL